MGARAPTTATVTALVVSPDGSKVVVGGSFTTSTARSNPGYGLGAVDATTGALLPWNVNSLDPQRRHAGGHHSPELATATASTAPATSSAAAATSRARSAPSWADGDHQLGRGLPRRHLLACAVPSGAVYAAGHPHYCGNIGGFPQTSRRRGRSTARIAFTQGRDAARSTADPYGYYNFAGNPAPSLLNWFPDFNAGTFTGQSQGPWSVAGNAQVRRLRRRVHDGQRHRASRASSASPSRRSPRTRIGPQLHAARTSRRTAISLTSGTVRVSWPANSDRDNVDPDVRACCRDGNDDHPGLHDRPCDSTFWNRPTMGFIDTGLTPGRHLQLPRSGRPTRSATPSSATASP